MRLNEVAFFKALIPHLNEECISALNLYYLDERAKRSWIEEAQSKLDNGQFELEVLGRFSKSKNPIIINIPYFQDRD